MFAEIPTVFLTIYNKNNNFDPFPQNFMGIMAPKLSYHYIYVYVCNYILYIQSEAWLMVKVK